MTDQKAPPASPEAQDAAGRILAQARARRDSMTPRDAAMAAFVPGGLSLDELEDLIREQRGLSPLHGGGGAPAR